MGAFPIQSNPGAVSEEVITHGVNGFLIENPFDTAEIARLIIEGLTCVALRETAQRYNVNYVDAHFNRAKLQSKIIALYQNVNLL
jgi:glycosyltransferase involved in cell wall biosynthesis